MFNIHISNLGEDMKDMATRKDREIVIVMFLMIVLYRIRLFGNLVVKELNDDVLYNGIYINYSGALEKLDYSNGKVVVSNHSVYKLSEFQMVTEDYFASQSCTIK